MNTTIHLNSCCPSSTLAMTKGKWVELLLGPEKDTVSLEKLVKIQIPPTLRKQLVDDWEFISQQDKS
ncbi:cellulose synthase like G3 [Prunus dulcis]|uniref:Cellulose synthase like G3 n=1 Tax=Prunus dulcis TaxID=3755 RepID=A0A4Y1RNL5_PRUDU|nr:cellulose synthase like G3 [Prunus dulcis]